MAPACFSRSSEYILKLSPLRSSAREWGYLATYERYRAAGYDTLRSRDTFVAAMLERDDAYPSDAELAAEIVAIREVLHGVRAS